jgi:hypothetical protein
VRAVHQLLLRENLFSRYIKPCINNLFLYDKYDYK